MRYRRGHNRLLLTPAYVVDENGCWVWQRATLRGYGRTGQRYAHRAYYEARYGPIPVGLVIDHLCRNPLCVNPDHLEAVTNAENVRRGAKALLDTRVVAEIRAYLSGGEPLSVIAERFGVSADCIRNVRDGRRWAD